MKSKKFAAYEIYRLDDAVDFLRWRLFYLPLGALKSFWISEAVSSHSAKIVESKILWLQSPYHSMKLGGGRHDIPEPFTKPIS